MILPLSCHGIFPRALALIEWKLNLLTFFSALLQLGATVHKLSPNSDFQYLKKDWRLFLLTSVIRFLSLGEGFVLRLSLFAPFIGLCLLCKGFHVFLSSFICLALCEVFAMIRG